MKKLVPGLVERLKALRGNRSQSEFAKMCGLQQQAYSKWELGSSPSAFGVVSICQATGCSADWLLGLKDEDGPRVSQAASNIGGSNTQVAASNCKDCATVARLLDSIAALTSRK